MSCERKQEAALCAESVVSSKREGTLTPALLSTDASQTPSPVIPGIKLRFFGTLNILEHVLWVNSTVTTFHELSRSITESVGLIRWDVLGRENLFADYKMTKLPRAVMAVESGTKLSPTIIMAESEN